MTASSKIVVAPIYFLIRRGALLLGLLLLGVEVLSSPVDSLKKELAFLEADSQRLELLLELTKALRSENITESFDYGDRLLELTRKQNNKEIEIEALNQMALNYYQIGNYDETLEYLFKAVVIVEESGDNLKLSHLYNDIGKMYHEIGQPDNAISYFENALQLKNKLNDSTTISYTLNNIGKVYMGTDQLELARDHFFTALAIDERLQDSVGIYSSLSNLGAYFMEKSMLDSSLSYFQRALPIVNAAGSPYDKGRFLNQWGDIYFQRGEPEEAISYYQEALQVGSDILSKAIIKDSYQGISDSYKALEDFEQALEYYQKYEAVEDSIFNEQNIKKIVDVQASYQLYKKQNEIELLKKEAEIKDLTLSNNKSWNIFLIVGIALIFILLVVLFQRNKIRTRTNKLLKKKNDEIVTQTQSILDSINYAKRIQEAIQPKHNQLFKYFQEAFVFTKARDIVNGDFYWFAIKGDYFVVAAVDCTGHGVPGAFMNVMGNSLLNQIVNAENITSPSEILAELNKRVVFNLHQTELSVNSNDGMDMALCTYSRRQQKMWFSGAKRPLVMIRNKEITLIKGESYPIGSSYYQVNRDYEEHSIDLQPNDKFYIFSDGITDQFGGKNNKKFMYSRLKDLLLEIESFPMDEQERVIQQNIMTWKGEQEQTDDILIVGVKI